MFPEIWRTSTKQAIKNQKWSFTISKKILNYKFFFFFGTVEQLLKVLFYLSTGFSFWKKTLETKTLP